MFSAKAQTSEKIFDDIFLLNNKKNKNLLLTNDDSKEDSLSCCLVSCMTSCFSWFFTTESFISLERSFDEKTPLLIIDNTKIMPFRTNIPAEIVSEIAMFLNYSDQLRLSHVNTIFRSGINEEFWERQITQQEYLLWDVSLPRSRIFFSNYFYYKGFGRDPKLPEKVVDRVENIMFLPNPKLAKKALDLGFPKGQNNYRQVEHKKTMLKLHCLNGENLLEWWGISRTHVMMHKRYFN